MHILKYLDKPVKIFGIKYTTVISLFVLSILCLAAEKKLVFITCLIFALIVKHYCKYKLGIRNMEVLLKIILHRKQHPYGKKRIFLR